MFPLNVLNTEAGTVKEASVLSGSMVVVLAFSCTLVNKTIGPLSYIGLYTEEVDITYLYISGDAVSSLPAWYLGLHRDLEKFGTRHLRMQS